MLGSVGQRTSVSLHPFWCVAILALVGGCATVPTLAGTGTALDPYRVARFEDLALIGREELGYSLGAHYLVIRDIEAAPTSDASYNQGNGWRPIGAFTFDGSGAPPRAGAGARMNGGFTGGIDGGGHTIRNLTVRTTSDYGGFIAGLVASSRLDRSSGYIRNIHFEHLQVVGPHPLGGVVGYNSGLIDNVSVSGEVAGRISVGGITAVNEGRIQQSSFTGRVSGVRYVAGIAAFNESNHYASVSSGISDTTATVHVTAESDAAAFVVVNNSAIHASGASGSVSSAERAAAFVFENYGTIYDVRSQVAIDWERYPREIAIQEGTAEQVQNIKK